MKRRGRLYEEICSIDNLILAEKKARKGKSKQRGVVLFDRNPKDNIINLHYVLANREYRTSQYDVFTIFEGKEREIYKLPYYPDRIVHHAIMNVLEPIFVASFTKDTYSCIKGRGIHKCLFNLRTSLEENNEYCLKVDIKKFYPNVNNTILKQFLRKKFKDGDLLLLLDEIIDSNVGLPIGNYLSQFFANFYLTYFDHWIKEELRVKHYFRYCDDIVILGQSKEELHNIRFRIQNYLYYNLGLELSNYQVFPIYKRGIDFVGYKSYHRYTKLRKGIKKRFIKMIKYNNNTKSKAAYNGWLVYCNSINLRQKYIKNEQNFRFKS